MGLLHAVRTWAGVHYVEEPDPAPVVGMRPGGAMVDPDEYARESARAAVEEDRRQAKLRLAREQQEHDLARLREEEEESMREFYRERARRELPQHLRHRGLGDD